MSKPLHTRGLPAVIERDCYESLVPVLRRYLMVEKSYLSADHVCGIMDGAWNRAVADVLNERRRLCEEGALSRTRARKPQHRKEV